MMDIPALIAKASSWKTFLVAASAYLVLSPVLTWHASQFLNGQPLVTRKFLASQKVHLLPMGPPPPELVRQFVLTGMLTTPLLAILASIALSALLRNRSAKSRLLQNVCLVPIFAAGADWIQHLLVAHHSVQFLVWANAATWFLFYGTGALLVLALSAFFFSVGRDGRQCPPSSSLAAKHYHTLRSHSTLSTKPS